MDTLDLAGAAELLKVNPETVRELATVGAILGAKVGVAWVFIKVDLLDYLRAEARRQTNERLAKAEAARELGEKPGRVSTATTAARVNRTRRIRPQLDALEQRGMA